MTILKRTSLLLSLTACLAVAGCGSDDEEGKPIPRAQAQALETRLGEAQRRLDDGSVGACRDILRDTQPAVSEILTSIPSSVDPDVRDALSESFDNLWILVDDECQTREPDEPAQTETTEQPTTPDETDTEPTETTPPPTDTEPTTPEEAPLPPEGDGENNGEVPPEGNGTGGGVGPGAAKEKKEKGK